MKHREPSLVLCDDLEGWDEGKGGRLKREGRYIYMYIYMLHNIYVLAETNTTL